MVNIESPSGIQEYLALETCCLSDMLAVLVLIYITLLDTKPIFAFHVKRISRSLYTRASVQSRDTLSNAYFIFCVQ